MDEKSNFDTYVDSIAKHLKEDCQGLGVMVIVHKPERVEGLEISVNTGDPLFSVGLLRLATMAVEDSVRSRTLSNLKTGTISDLINEKEKDKLKVN